MSDAKVQKSLYGNRFGLDHNRHLVLDGGVAAYNPAHGANEGLPSAGITENASLNSGSRIFLGNGVGHSVHLQLKNESVTVAATGIERGRGNLLLFTMPQGVIFFNSAVAKVSLSIATAEQSNFTDGTPSGDFSVGTTAIDADEALGTDASDDDLCEATAYTMANYALASTWIRCNSTDTAFPYAVDGSATAQPVYFNIIVDAADINDDASTAILVSGDVWLEWTYIGG